MYICCSTNSLLGISTLKFLNRIQGRPVASRILRLGHEIINAGGALHRVVSSLLHRCGRLRPMVAAYPAVEDMDPALHAFVLPFVWTRGSESMAEGTARCEARVAEGERHWTRLRGHSGSTQQTESLVEAAWSEGPDARALLVNSFREWKTAADVPSRARRPSADARRRSFECASRKIYRRETWSRTEWSHLHCLFGEEGLGEVVRRAVQDVLHSSFRLCSSSASFLPGHRHEPSRE